MNPSTAQARVLVDELVRHDVRQVVLCPGSRNAALAMALHRASVAGQLVLHVRIDERSAAFFALGLVRGSGRPVAVVCTSGTAVANLHPAMLEAAHSHLPLIALTADRPVELVGSGASQTTVQHGIFGALVSTVDFPMAERRAGQNAVWRGMVGRSLRADGPVHLNVPFREPLVPDDGDDWPEDLAGRDGGRPWTVVAQIAESRSGATEIGHLGERTLVVVGDAPPSVARATAAFAAAAGWPVIVEPLGFAAGDTVATGSLMLAAGLPSALRPESLLVVGHPSLSRGVQRVIRETPVVHVISEHPQWTDPQHQADFVTGPLAVEPPSFGDAWLSRWQDADVSVKSAVDKFLADEPWPTGLHVAQLLLDALPYGATLFLGSSNPVRDVDLVAPHRSDLRMLANRGLAGIDGTLSCAVGASLDTEHGYALVGDLTFLHDINGLLIGPGELRPNLAIVVLNDDGGGIFSLLEQGSPEHADSFERVFGTPHGADLGALCAGYGVPHTLVRDAAAFRAALAPADGIRIVEVRADRTRLRDLHSRLRSVVAEAW
ncbi:2-succinyl-5-enolpyruvyl-6-hydroxy-3-cyclohexene-1-carboxylic-acid synthase [Kutzneria sp. CA-103260]|uniref:2-succinyl-5-enolpyruvyl-6-hydroxy-3- cyclohexene-1-carboxylic-acid synthase n=1 Tax=Kutzneria sp. CA-103260 TaxID=2802641 RepID=UPI001BA49BD7|nr:2-succinyl-5-enolpyruvyl-6-hydroxy-3-cyclohexene-1-carboxylic-acid synthase [Kutzneria sp. CA-103260]QUQ70527.1 2-succinyl-5-enolpyruvyl-6-hydroxy-3- cyclohexene-1-carboxylate synthase [Kutzneria sp. CA-103260]